MTASVTIGSDRYSAGNCHHCNSRLEVHSKFCGGCGCSTINTNSNSFLSLKQPSIGLQQLCTYEQQSRVQDANRLNHAEAKVSHHLSTNAHSQVQNLPNFASGKKKSNPELEAEIFNLSAQIFKEQIYLIFHWCLFLTVHAFGLFIALKCYSEFIGDDLSRLIMAMTPLIFINLVGLVAIVPIKKTKRQIGLLQQKMTYAKLKIEYENLL